MSVIIDKNSIIIPGVSQSNQILVSASLVGRSDPTLGQPAVTGSYLGNNVYGAGWSLGNIGGWSVFANVSAESTAAQRGISHNYSGVFTKHAVGDTAGFYSYTNADGGMTAPSDEGVTAGTFQCIENFGWFHGTISSTTGLGDKRPTYNFTSGNNWTTDGAFMLNITKGTISGNMNGESTPLLLDIGSGPASTFLNQLPVTGVTGGTLPLSTAIGIATAGIANHQVNAANPISTNVTVNLAKIGGVFQPFTVNSLVWVAGINFPEQSIITAVTTPVTVGSNRQQTITLKLRNPNSQAILFQGGLVGNYISFDANIALPGGGMRSSYYAFGSLTGTSLIYGLQVAGGVQYNILPMIGNEAATNTGANSGFHLYPGAEVVANNNFGTGCTLEQNGVNWQVADVVENPHYPVYGGAALFVNRYQTTPTHPGFGSSTLSLLMDGAGLGGGNAHTLSIINNYQHTANYAGAGGPLIAPGCIIVEGAFNTLLYFNQVPDTGAILHVEGNPNNHDIVKVMELNWTLGGNMTFTSSQGKWMVDGAFDAQNGFFVNHVPGVSGTFTTADSKTVTVSKGLIIGIV